MMVQIILRSTLVVIVLLIATNVIAQNDAKRQPVPPDTTCSFKFNWELENEERERDNMSYAGANICSRWIKFSDQEFLKLKDFDGMNVKITVKRSVWEGLESMKARGVDTQGMQGTSGNISCKCILTIELDDYH